jgi:hypothetical protein
VLRVGGPIKLSRFLVGFWQEFDWHGENLKAGTTATLVLC